MKNKKYKNIAFIGSIMVFIIFFCLGCNRISPEEDLLLIEKARNSQTIEGYQGYLEKAPKGEYVEEALIALAGLGEPFPDAPEYDSESKELFPIVIIEKYNPDSELETEYAYKYHEWNDNLPEDLAAETINDAALFAIIETVSVYYSSREYTGPYTLPGFILNTNVEIREAKTGKTIFAGVLEGTKPDFPYRIPANTYFVAGSEASYSEFYSWLFLRLTQPDEIITDPVLEEAIRLTLQHMGNSVGETLTVDDLQKLTYLRIVPAAARNYYAAENFADGSVVVVEGNISQVEGLDYAVNLQVLNLSFNNIDDISPLEGLYNLDSLIIDNDTYTNNSATVGVLEAQGCQILRNWPPESYNYN